MDIRRFNVDLKELILFSLFITIVAFTANYFSPVGIALMGDWDEKKGVVSAKSKKSAVNHKREIGDLAEIKKLFNKGVLFMDARSSEKFNEGHIKGAVSVPANEFEAKLETIWKKYPRDLRIIAYCSGFSCQDSHILAKSLEEIGYTNVSVFPGGFPQWKKEGLPVEK